MRGLLFTIKSSGCREEIHDFWNGTSLKPSDWSTQIASKCYQRVGINPRLCRFLETANGHYPQKTQFQWIQKRRIPNKFTQIQLGTFQVSLVSTGHLQRTKTGRFSRIIELGGIQYKRSCSEILFDEWGTSGRPRASLGHLKYLLAKAELFRAADYLAKLLGEKIPVRPANGPAAVIPTNLSEIQPHVDTSTADVEKHLDELNYPQIAIQKIRKKSDEVKHLVPVSWLRLCTYIFFLFD